MANCVVYLVENGLKGGVLQWPFADGPLATCGLCHSRQDGQRTIHKTHGDRNEFVGLDIFHFTLVKNHIYLANCVIYLVENGLKGGVLQ